MEVTLSIHHVEKIDLSKICFYVNTTYCEDAIKLCEVNYENDHQNDGNISIAKKRWGDYK